jgi:hypothetical protein
VCAESARTVVGFASGSFDDVPRYDVM